MEAVVTQSMYYRGICLEGRRKQEKFQLGCRCPDRDSNRAPPECESKRDHYVNPRGCLSLVLSCIPLPVRESLVFQNLKLLWKHTNSRHRHKLNTQRFEISNLKIFFPIFSQFNSAERASWPSCCQLLKLQFLVPERSIWHVWPKRHARLPCDWTLLGGGEGRGGNEGCILDLGEMRKWCPMWSPQVCKHSV